MVIRIKKFGICCDRCKKESRNLDGNVLYDTYAEAVRNVPEDWIKVGRQYFCPDCQTYNEETDQYEPVIDEE